MTNYDYDKALVSVPKLRLEILADETIQKTLTGLSYNVDETPANLHITFDIALTTEEETALDTLVTNHDGQPLNSYERWCSICHRLHVYIGLSLPTDCICCGGTDCLYTTTEIITANKNIICNDRCKGYQNISQSLLTGVWVPVTLDAEDYDTADMFASDNKIVVKRAGPYIVDCLVTFLNNAIGFRYVRMLKGTSLIASFALPALGGGSYTRIPISLQIDFAADDEITIEAQQTSGESLGLVTGAGGTFLAALRVGGG